MANIDNDPLGVLGTPASADVSPIKSSPPRGSKEHRKETRYKAAWKTGVTIQGGGLLEGKIKDISLHGAAIMIGRNIKPRTELTLHIHIPSLAGPAAPKIMTVHGIAAYTVHDGNEQCFRVGISFVKFEPASERNYLEARLVKHHMKIL